VLAPVVPLLAMFAIPQDAVAQVCGARATVRQTAMKMNDDGTRTVRYRADVLADREAAQCTNVHLMVMRSYVKADGSTVEEGIPLSLEVHDRKQFDGEEVLPTSKLVYWWTDRVRCEPCAGAAQDAKAPTSPQGSEKRAAGDAASGGKGKKTVLGMVGAVALGVLLVL
jgi:hypothetical protein